ncbi:MAG: hypothetical protein K2L12_05050 [Clostridia bacterium]|nr:hypothetical protein [Clostridia bacterium]
MKRKALFTTVSIICAVIIALLAFTAGYYTHKGLQSKSLSSYEWYINTVKKYYYYDVDESVFTEYGLKGFASKYLDRYSEYYTKEEYKAIQSSNEGSKSGLGLSFAYVQGKGVYISSVIGNSPAYMQGLRAGEWLEGGGKGGSVTPFESQSDFTNLVTSAKDGEDITFVSVSGKEYTIAKAEYTASYAYMATNSTAWTFGDSADGGLAMYENVNERITYLPQGCAYLHLSQFYGSAEKQVYYLLEKFNASKCTSLVLDLRSNGGGYVKTMQAIAGCFADGNRQLAMVSRDKYGKEMRYNCMKVTNPDYRVSKNIKVYVLANSMTASASEALIGTMICYGALDYKNIFLSDYSEEYNNWVKSAGEEVKTAQTYGKGIMQSPFTNNRTGEVLKLTTAKIYWPDGKTCIHDRGVTVEDGCVPIKVKWEHTLPDEELQLACQIISSR